MTPARRAAAAVLLLTLSCATPALACPMCKDGTSADPATAAQPDAAGLDFNGSVYAMLGVVTLVGGAVGRAMFKAVRG